MLRKARAASRVRCIWLCSSPVGRPLLPQNFHVVMEIFGGDEILACCKVLITGENEFRFVPLLPLRHIASNEVTNIFAGCFIEPIRANHFLDKGCQGAGDTGIDAGGKHGGNQTPAELYANWSFYQMSQKISILSQILRQIC